MGNRQSTVSAKQRTDGPESWPSGDESLPARLSAAVMNSSPYSLVLEPDGAPESWLAHACALDWTAALAPGTTSSVAAREPGWRQYAGPRVLAPSLRALGDLAEEPQPSIEALASTARVVVTELDSVLTLAEVAARGLGTADVGGKALRLAAMAVALDGGRAASVVRIPSAVVITTAAYRRHLLAELATPLAALVADVRADRRVADATLESLSAALGEMSLDAPLVAALGQFIDSLPAGTTLAVRSSATMEDGASHSLAGLCDTFLHVAPTRDAVAAAVVACWASLWTPRVVAHLRRTAATSDELGACLPAMAVVVQRMVPARAAGVVFTVDPMSGDERRMRVEAVHGLGEALVSGEVSPHSFTVDWTHIVDSPSRSARSFASAVAATATATASDAATATTAAASAAATTTTATTAAITGAASAVEPARAREPLVSEPYSPQLTKHTLIPADSASGQSSRVGSIETSAYERATPPLDGAALNALLAAALAIARLYGSPQDVEWVIDEADGSLFVTQARPVTSLTVALAALDGDEWFSGFTYKSWLAMSISSVTAYHASLVVGRQPEATVAIASEGAITQVVFGVVYVGRRAWVERAHARAYLSAVGLTHTPIALRWVASWREREPALVAALTALSPASPIAALAGFAYLLLRDRLEASFHSFSIGSSADSALKALESALGSSGARADAFMANVVDSTGAALRELADSARAFAATATADELAAVCNAKPSALGAQLESLAAGAAAGAAGASALVTLARATMTLVRRFYFMAGKDEDIFARRWAAALDVPAAVLQREIASAAARREAGEASDAPPARVASDWRALLAAHPKRASLTPLVTTLRDALGAKESVHETYCRVSTLLAAALSELGSRWVAYGVLDAPGDLCYASHTTLRRALWRTISGEASSDDPALVALGHETRVHKAVRQCWRNFTRPRSLECARRVQSGTGLVGMGPALAVLAGKGCSDGVFEGRAFVAHSLEDAIAGLGYGDVLVTHTTSPGWTLLFGTCGALVTEVGGMLSHGAVLARECRIPAVLRVDDATTRIRTGERVRVDGRAGTVTLVARGTPC